MFSNREAALNFTQRFIKLGQTQYIAIFQTDALFREGLL